MGTALLWVVATENFRRVDEVLNSSNPELHQRLEPLKPGDARLLLRFLASELNRFYFTAWGSLQLIIGGVILALGWRLAPDPPGLVLLSVMWILSAILLIWVIPPLVDIGRQVDFVPRSPPPAQMGTFWRYHLAYTLVDLIKFSAGIFWLLRTGLKRA